MGAGRGLGFCPADCSPEAAFNFDPALPGILARGFLSQLAGCPVLARVKQLARFPLLALFYFFPRRPAAKTEEILFPAALGVFYTKTLFYKLLFQKSDFSFYIFIVSHQLLVFFVRRDSWQIPSLALVANTRKFLHY